MMAKSLFSGSKYDNVDKDWIDIKSNNYFSPEEFQAEEKRESGNGKEIIEKKGEVDKQMDKEKRPRKSKSEKNKDTKAWFVEF